jgi:hypothetical protein
VSVALSRRELRRDRVDVRGAHHHGGDRRRRAVADVGGGAAGVGGRAGLHVLLRPRHIRLRRAARRVLPARRPREGATEPLLHGRRPRLPRYTSVPFVLASLLRRAYLLLVNLSRIGLSFCGVIFSSWLE